LLRPELRSGRVAWAVEEADGGKGNGKKKRGEEVGFGDQGIGFKVLGKAKGMCGIMDLPSQDYTFSY
jgi:hypothetical protein